MSCVVFISTACYICDVLYFISTVACDWKIFLLLLFVQNFEFQVIEFLFLFGICG